jgi:ribonuclease P protein component
MTRRADYLAANRGLRAPMPGFVLLVHDRRDGDPTPRLGITVSKKIGGAVVRNRMKRRFRELGRALLPAAAIAGADHVLIGREGGIERDFATLREELAKALAKLGRRHAEGGHARKARDGAGQDRLAGQDTSGRDQAGAA